MMVSESLSHNSTCVKHSLAVLFLTEEMMSHASKLEETTVLLERYQRELTLFSCFGLDRDGYGDHYNEEKDMYITSIPSEQYDPTNPAQRLENEWVLYPGDDEEAEIKRRRLIKHRGRLFFPEEIISNIAERDDLYFEFLVCYDFTSSIMRLMTFVNGKGKELTIADQDRYLGYEYSYMSPVGKEDRLSLLLRRDGVYVCQIKFTEEDHAFCVIVDGDTMTVLNRYEGNFYVVVSNKKEGLRKLRLLEENREGTNKDLIKDICGFKPYYKGDYMILHLIQCDYWSIGVTSNEMADFFLYISEQAFKNREEEEEIAGIVAELWHS